MKHSRLSYYVVDAFADRPFTGNPAAVVPLDAWRDDHWLQNVAMEMNLSETAFLVRNGNGYDLRWFTPKSEVDLCGHATVAAAKVLVETGKLLEGERVIFSTRSGTLAAQRQETRILLDFPALPCEPCQPPPGLFNALGVRAGNVYSSKFDLLVELESEQTVRELAPDFEKLGRIECRGVIVTARSGDPQFDFVSRFFAPVVGINEDPVTGSAHCVLAPFWGARLGKSQMTGFQASSRSGIVYVEVRGERVILGGEAVIFAEGELMA